MGFRVGPGAVAASEALGGIKSSHLGFDLWHVFGFVAAFAGFGLTAYVTRDRSGGRLDRKYKATNAERDESYYQGGNSGAAQRRPVPREPEKQSSYPVPEPRDRFYPYMPADQLYGVSRDDKTMKSKTDSSMGGRTEKTDTDDSSMMESTIATSKYHDSHGHVGWRPPATNHLCSQGTGGE